MGNDATGTGTLRVDGGAVVTGSLQVLTGSAEISAGQITVRAGETIGQGYTAASFNQTGGTHIVNGIAAGGDTLRIGDPVRDNAPSAFALGGGTLVINGNTGNYGSFVQTGGTATMQAVAGSGSVAVGGGTSPASLLAVSVRQSDLSIGDNGALSLRQGSVPVTNAVANLVISGSGRLNLANNNLLIQYPAKHSPVAAVAQHLASGTNAGAWNGPGIDSTQARGALSLGFADSADAGINGIAANSIEVKLTLVGDANLDGRVNFTDLLDLSQHYGKAATAWDAGDFNYDGTVGFDDLLMLAQNFGRTFSPADAVAEAPDRLSQVPEPTLASLLAAGVLVLWPHRRLRVHPANKRPLI